MKKFCLRANYLALFKRTSISISTKKELQINESKIACCPITLFACLVELWKGENLNKVTLGNSYWTRESQYDIGVGFSNETKKFFSLIHFQVNTCFDLRRVELLPRGVDLAICREISTAFYPDD
jgi:hypothetical protein